MGNINRTVGVPQDSEIKTSILWSKVKNDQDIVKYMPDYTQKKTPNRQYLIDIINTIHPGVMKLLVLQLRAKKVKKREAKMKKYVIVKKSFAQKLKNWHSKRKDEKFKPGRFIGLMQEDRKVEAAVRKRYSKVDFDFNFDELVKKVKYE